MRICLKNKLKLLKIIIWKKKIVFWLKLLKILMSDNTKDYINNYYVLFFVLTFVFSFIIIGIFLRTILNILIYNWAWCVELHVSVCPMLHYWIHIINNDIRCHERNGLKSKTNVNKKIKISETYNWQDCRWLLSIVHISSWYNV